MASDKSTLTTQLVDDFLAQVTQYKPPAYMLNSTAKKRVLQSFLTAELAVGSQRQLKSVAEELECIAKEVAPDSTNDPVYARAEYANDNESIGMRGIEAANKNSNHHTFSCEIVKGRYPTYRSLVANDVLFEEHAQRLQEQPPGGRDFEQSFFCSNKKTERSFRLIEAPDPDSEKTLFAGKKTQDASELMLFRPGRGMIFHYDRDLRRKTHTVKVWTISGELMYHAVDTIGQPPDVRCRNDKLIEGECSRWGACASKTDTTAGTLVHGTLPEQSGDIFSQRGGEFKFDHQDPRLANLMTEVSDWGNLPKLSGAAAKCWHSMTDTECRAGSRTRSELAEDFVRSRNQIRGNNSGNQAFSYGENNQFDQRSSSRCCTML